MISKPASDLFPSPISLVGKPWVEGVQCAQKPRGRRGPFRSEVVCVTVKR